MMGRLIRNFLSICTILILVQPAFGAEFQTWSDFTTIYEISERWRYTGDQGIRGVLSGSDFTLLFVRPSVRYRVKPWFTAHGGIRFFYTNNEDDPDSFEIGPWQGLRFLWPKIGKYTVSHYLRLEQRMIWRNTGQDDFDFTLRSRYQLGATSPTYDILFKNGIFLSASIEAFANIEDSVFVNRIRYDVGAGTRVSKAWRIQLHYLLHQDKDSPGDTFSIDEHILRLRLFYSFN